MGIASLILGIISVAIAFFPICGTIVFVPALVGLVLGIIDLVKKSKLGEPKGMAIAGVVCSGCAILFILGWWLLAVIGAIGEAASL